MIRNIIRTAAAVLSRTAYEDGRRDGAGLVPRRELEEARAEAKKLRESVANERSYRDSWELAYSKAIAERDEAHRGELHALDSRGKVIADRDAWKSRAEKAEAALAPQPAAYPWTDEAVERATRAAIAERDRLGDEERTWVEDAPKFAVSSRIVRAALATLAPPPQAAPVPPMGVGDVWGDAVRVEYDGGDAYIIVGSERRGPFAPWHYAEETAASIRRGLASLPPLRAVLVGGVTEEMLEAYTYKQAWARYEASGDGRPFTMDECKAAGLTAALAAANIRVLGPGEGVVRVRVCEAGEKCPSGSVYRLPTSHWYGSGAGGSVCETSEAWYILAADLDAAAAGLGKGGANG